MHSYIEDHAGSFGGRHEYTLPLCAKGVKRIGKTIDSCVINS